MNDEKITVLNPEGYPPEITWVGMADRPDALDGKTIYLVDCRFDDGDILIEQMANWFTEEKPDVRIEVRRKSGVYTERDEELYEEIQQKGDGAVVAVGH